MTKRDIFLELLEGFDALKDEREGKRILKTYEVECNVPPEPTPPEATKKEF